MAVGLFRSPDGTLRCGWKAVLFVAAHGGASWLVWSSGLFGMVTWTTWLLGSVTLTVAISWLFLALEGRPLVSMGWPGRDDGGRWSLECLLGILGGMALMGGVALCIWLAGGFHWERGQASFSDLLYGLGFYLLVALAEEAKFRGYAFQRLAEGLGDWGALGLGAVWFAYAHGENPGMSGATRIWALVNIGLAAVLMGLAYLRTRRLGFSIGIHLGWNWAQGTLLGFGVSGFASDGLLKPVFHGQPTWLTGGPFGLEASLPCALVNGGVIVLLVLWKPRSLERS